MCLLRRLKQPKRYRISLPICSCTWLGSDMHPLLGSPSSQASARETSGASLTGASPGRPPGVDQGSMEIPDLFPPGNTLGLEDTLSNSEKPPAHTTALASVYTNALPACRLGARGGLS